MKILLRLTMILLSAAIALVVVDVHAGDKKDKDKNSENVVVNDTITNKDQRDKARSTSYCKTYIFKMNEGKTYQLDMVSGEFDSYLRVENPDGQQVAADDDGGGYPNARIIYRAPKTGDFTIICTTYRPDALGKYTLTVKENAN